MLAAELSRLREVRDELQKELTSTAARLEHQTQALDEALVEVQRLASFARVADADTEVARMMSRMRDSAQSIIAAAKVEADQLRSDAAALRAQAREALEKSRVDAERIGRSAVLESEAEVARGRASAATLMAEAEARAGEALSLLGRERELRTMVEALENRLNGYDDRYIQPAALLLERLAEGYGSAQAAVELKAARAHTRRLLTDREAAACDYVESSRRDTAERFVAEAFNGAADSILARVKVDNFGKLTRELEDAASIINMHGRAFRNARVTPQYLAARRQELVAAARFQELLRREADEQKAIRERIREEARAQREFEAAQRSAAREEDRVRKALAEAQRRFDASAQEDRAKMEERLQALQLALAEAQAKSVRALSMAQQTRAGHCYVISNEGSFGVDVLKIGMTRRLDPLDRVRELGDASVPFEFDVHAMVFSEDAPSLEKMLHREFNERRVNMVNPRKEYFHVGVAQVREKLAAMGVQAEFTLAAAAREYRESQALRQASAEERRAVLEAVLSAEEQIEDDAEEMAEVTAPAARREAEQEGAA